VGLTKSKLIVSKVEASALFIVIVIALVIGLICSSLILVAYNYKCRISDNLGWKRIEDNLNSSIHLLLSDSELITFDTPQTIDLYEEGTDSVFIKKLHWGIYEVGVVKSFYKRFSLEKKFIYGYQPDDFIKSAIYLVDEGRPLSIAGTTFIKGTCYLPEAGIKTAYIEGTSYEGEEKVRGKIEKSKNTLPKPDPEICKRMKDYLLGNYDVTDSTDVLNGLNADTIRRSFFQSTLIIKMKKKSSLSKVFLSGNIIITADTTLVIDSSAKLNDVILFAPGVEILEGFNGSLQIVAKDSVKIGKSCNLKYPSSVCLLKTDFKVMQPFIILKEDSKVSGLVFTTTDVQDLQFTKIIIEKNALVEGQVFSDGFVDIQGKVHGNVTCKTFSLKTPSSTYENHLLNATIDNSRLSKYYIGSSILFTERKKRLIKYLD
jgi:hypothetical protein